MIPEVGQKFMVTEKSPDYNRLESLIYNRLESLIFACVKVDSGHVYGVNVHDKDEKLRFAFSEWIFRQPSFSYSYTFAPMQTQVSPSKIPPDMLKILIMLCHPDKHNNSVASTKAIKYLLEQR